MAVTFKVPASPAKSIFTIDEFLGVDLTNSPANIADNRSPNAPNMTRLVPGKVRKRMGYAKELIFGTKTNVNWALGTSCEQQDIVIDDSNVGMYITLYELMSPMLSAVTFSFEYKADAGFGLFTGALYASYSSSQTWKSVSSSSSHASYLKIYSATKQTISIRNFAITYARDEHFKWSPAPERLIETNDNREVYGFHKYKSSSTEEGNYMTDINRALETGTSKSISGSGTYRSDILYYFAERMPGRNVIVKFDYNYTVTTAGTNLYMNIGSATIATLDRTVGTHSGTFVSDPITLINASGNDYIALYNGGTVFSGTISNLSVLYDMSDSYTWTAAPEDATGDIASYYPENLYDYSDTNVATIRSYSDTTSGTAQYFYRSIQIQNNNNILMGQQRLSFDITGNAVSGGSYIQKIVLYVYLRQGYSSTYRTVKIAEITGNDVTAFDGHYEYLLDSANLKNTPEGSGWRTDYSVYDIRIGWELSTVASMTYQHSLSNISLVQATQKSDLNKSYYANLYHVGNRLFAYRSSNDTFTTLSSSLNNHRSMSWQFGKKLFLIDGRKNYLYDYQTNTLSVVGENNAYIPLVTISKLPDGGGTSYEALNLLQPGFYEQFICTSSYTTTKTFQLSFRGLDSSPTCRAWVLNSSGEWVEKTYGTDFSVNTTDGTITFTTAPGQTPVDGQDNVKILAYRTVDGYADRISGCTFGTLFGVNGATDRLFLSGNPAYPNYDWYSGMYDPTYFPDTGYTNLGKDNSAIVGYSLVNNYLATHKDINEPSQSVFIREGDMIPMDVTTSVGTTVTISEPAFKLKNALQGSPALTPYTFGYVETEPLFLTKSGVFALTTQDITGEKYGQNRSFYLNGELTEEKNLSNAYAIVHDNMYYLAVNNRVYLLDGLQATRTDRSDPYSTRQYVGYVWDNIPATILFTDNDTLYFGTADGKICRFYNEVDSLDSYNDDGYPIDAWWETPDLDGKLFYKNKTFRYFAARLMASLATSVKMWAMKAGAWTLIKTDNSTGRYFDFGNINFEKFSFSTDQTEKVVHTKIKVKKVDKARFKLENDTLNEPFGLFNIALEYVENGNYKG